MRLLLLVPLAFLFTTPHVRAQTNEPTVPVLSEDHRLVAEPRSPTDAFGAMVALAGDDLVVNAVGATPPGGAREAGVVYIFSRDADGAWSQKDVLSAPGPPENVEDGGFGAGFSVSGDRLLVGAPYVEQPDLWTEGAAYVYERSAETSQWELAAELDPGLDGGTGWFAMAVGLDGDTALITDPGHEAPPDAYILERSRRTGTWVYTDSLQTLPDAQPAPWGMIADLSDGVALTSDFGYSHYDAELDTLYRRAGEVYAYARDEATGDWALETRLRDPEPGFSAEFGYRVAIEGDFAAIGTSYIATDDAWYGRNRVYLFRRDAATRTWALEATIRRPDPRDFADLFARSLALSEDGRRLVVGAPTWDADLSMRRYVGRAFVYDYDDEAGTWTLSYELAPSVDLADTRFGAAVAVSGDRIAITSVNVDDQGGAVYVFESVPRRVASERAPVPEGFALGPPQPNPASGRVRLTLSAEQPQHVRAEAYDVLGRRVAVLFEGRIAAETDLTANAQTWPAGVYAIRVTGETSAATRRLVVVR